MASTPCFGIDLGTTCSAIAVVRDGTPVILPVDGDLLMPSVVVFRSDGEVLVGAPAHNVAALEADRAVLSSKRHMGTDHTWSIGDRSVTPVDVAEHILRRLGDAAERELGIRPERVVITVPAWFTQAQRADTRLAGERAGYTVERIINEPTAAALAHAHGQDRRARSLVYDLGGGTFDVSLVEQDGDLVEVRASHGDSRLGGDDIDLALADHVLREIARTDRPLRDAIDASVAARVRLRMAVELAKLALSETTETTLRVPFLLELDGAARHLELPLDRATLEQVSLPFLERTLRSVERVLHDSDTDASSLDELLLVGGSTLQPLVWHLLRDDLGIEGSHAIPPRRAVVLGAAIQGAIVDGSRTHGILVDVAPYSLCAGAIEVGVDDVYACHVLTPRNTPLPSRHTEMFSTAGPGQRRLKVDIFQGASPDPRRNVLIGRVEMDDLPPPPPGDWKRPIRVEFRHDLDGMVQIGVTDVLANRTVEGRVAADGAEQSALREELEAMFEEGDVVPAYDPTGDDEGGEVETVPGAEDDVEDARLLFDAVLSRAGELDAAFVEAATEGLALLEAGDDEGAITRYDSLADRLFDAGIYL